MSKLNLDLQAKNDEEIRTFGNGHKAAMAGNAAYPAPVPTAVLFDADLAAYSDKLDEIVQAEAALIALREEKDALRAKVEQNITIRGNHVEIASGGVPAVIATSALPMQSAPTTTTSMAPPTAPKATTGDNEGEVDLSCNAVPKAKSYLREYRTHEDGQVPGPWIAAIPASTSNSTIGGLVPGKHYGFRIRALGPHDLLSPWSDECTGRAA